VKRTRVLLADDNKDILDFVRNLFSEEFEIVAAVRDGLSALSAAKRFEPDILILDISMPGLSGIEVAKDLRETGLNAWIIFLTVHEDADVLEVATSIGSASYVIKSCVLSDLPAAVKAALSGRQFVSHFNRSENQSQSSSETDNF